MEFYIYILYSESIDKFYIGYSQNVFERLKQHNSSTFNTYTSKGRPWVIKAIYKTPSKSYAISIERFIKRQHSKSLFLKLIDETFIPAGKLAQLVRVPHMRD